jgi:hypothetical protein
MTYEMALDYEQERRVEQDIIAEEWREIEAYQEAEARFSRLMVGKHPLCPCGLKQAQDCNCPF